MRRLLIFLFLGVLTVASSQAQMARGGAKLFRPGVQANAGEKVVRNLQQQSRRAEQAAREAAAASRLKLKPSGIRIVAVPNLDNDDQKRKDRGGDPRVRPIKPKPVNVKSLPKIKTLSEYEDERIAAKYDSIKTLVNKGVYLGWPYDLFKIADYAMRHDDEQFAITCLGQVQVDRVTPKYLELIGRCYPALNVFMPEISRAVAVSAYCKMLDAKLLGVDCDSARMQNGDTLLIVTDQFAPSLNPLVILSCFYEPSLEVERYKELADSVIATYNQWSAAFKDAFARDFVITLMDKGEHATALDYFGREPLKQFPDSLVDITLDMVSCARATHNDSLASSYLEQAAALDPDAANDYWRGVIYEIWDTFMADTSQLELADWLFEQLKMPDTTAMVMAEGLIGRYWPEAQTSWKWVNLSDDTPKQKTARRATLYILDKGGALDEGLSESDVVHIISYFKASMMAPDPEKVAEVRAILDKLTAINNPALRSRAIVLQAYIAAHGLDKPKEALKILKKNIKQLDNPEVTTDVRNLWYDYMATLCTSLGKSKEADKYLKRILAKTHQ